MSLKLQHVLSISTTFHNILSKLISERQWETVFGRQGDQDQVNFSFYTDATATVFELSLKPAEVKLMPSDHEWAWLFPVHVQEAFRGARGAGRLLDVAVFLDYKAEQIACVLPPRVKIRLFLRHLSEGMKVKANHNCAGNV